jgi:threonine/homoserine/homoserine lactone efflux protein
MIEFVIAGTLFGLSSGLVPSPLMAFVVSQSLRYGPREGMKASIAPFFTSVPIVLTNVFVLSCISCYKPVLGVISLLGVAFVAYLGLVSFRATSLDAVPEQARPKSLGKAMLVNLFSPQPYLFWLLAGGPTVLRAWQHSAWAAGAFLATFYCCMVGSKLVISNLVGHGRQWVTGRPYKYTMQLLGVAMFAMALLLLRDALGLFGVIPGR